MNQKGSPSNIQDLSAYHNCLKKVQLDEGQKIDGRGKEDGRRRHLGGERRGAEDGQMSGI
jgi:hypothetical protein